MRTTIETIAVAVALLVAALTLHAWLASRSEQRRLQSTVADQTKQLSAAASRERDRDAQLKTSIAQIEQLKGANQTPEQIVQGLAQDVPLPEPFTFGTPTDGKEKRTPAAGPSTVQNATLNDGPADQPTDQPKKGTGRREPQQGTLRTESVPSAAQDADSTDGNSLPSAASAQASAQIPTADLKPLYNYVQDCRECRQRLAAATQNAHDDALQLQALTRERDAAVTAAKGGTLLRRLRRNALWFAVGAACGLAASRR